MVQKYATQTGENTGHAIGRALPISRKHSREICAEIRGKSLVKARKFLEAAVKMETPVPFKRHAHNVGHRKGDIRSGRYPVKALSHVLMLLNSAEANAKAKGLNEDKLVVEHTCAHKGSNTWRMGRQRRMRAKRTHVEIVLKEGDIKEKVKKKVVKKAAPKKAAPKVEEKKVEPVKEEVKQEAPKVEEKKEEAKPDLKTEAKEEKKE